MSEAQHEAETIIRQQQAEIERLNQDIAYLLQKSKFDTERLTQALKLNSLQESEITELKWGLQAIVYGTEAAWCQWHGLKLDAERQLNRMSSQVVAMWLLGLESSE